MSANEINQLAREEKSRIIKYLLHHKAISISNIEYKFAISSLFVGSWIADRYIPAENELIKYVGNQHYSLNTTKANINQINDYITM